MQPLHGYLFIRAVLERSEDRYPFDEWYANEHLSRAVKLLQARCGWRFWSDDEGPPDVHYAVYEFDSKEALERAVASAPCQRLVGEFDARWRGRVARTRSRVVVAQTHPDRHLKRDDWCNQRSPW